MLGNVVSLPRSRYIFSIPTDGMTVYSNVLGDYVMYCPSCGTPMPDEVAVCSGCGWQEYVASLEDDVAMRILLPIGRSGFAILAGYLGLLSPLFIFAPPALLFGILAIRDIKRNPKKGGMGRAIFGTVMGGLFTLVLVGILTVAVLESM